MLLYWRILLRVVLFKCFIVAQCVILSKIMVDRTTKPDAVTIII